MSTWHQDRASTTPMWHESLFTVVTDPPLHCQTLSRFATYAEAETYITNLSTHHPLHGKHSYILLPGKRT